MSRMIQSIPERYVDAFVNLAKFSDEQMIFIKDAVSSVKPSLGANRLAKKMPSVLDLSRKDFSLLVEAIVPLYSLREEYGFSNEEIAESITDLAREHKGFGSLNPSEFESLRVRLLDLLQYDKPLGITSKASSVLTDHKNIFITGKILTDVRPVFIGDADEQPEAAVIVHQLKIHYHSEDKCKEFYVALDTSDVESLREVLERADRKATALKEFLKNTSVEYLEI